MKFDEARYVLISDGEGAEATVLLSDENLHQSVHNFMCFCGKPWQSCECGESMVKDVKLIDATDEWVSNEKGEPFSVCWPHEAGKITLYRLSNPVPIPKNFSRMWHLICRFVQCECSQTSYAELKGSQSMDIPVEFLALCEFAEEMGVKLP